MLRLAVALYQWLGRKTRTLPRGGLVFRRELRRRYPGIASRYRAAAYEFEGLIASPERVAIELIEDGVAASRRSAALNYAEIAGFDGRDVIVRDQRSGACLRARPRVVVNAAGAGADRVASLFGVEAHMVDGVAGTHLLLRAPSVARALGEDLLFFEDGNSDPERRRLCAAYAVGDQVLLGATERPVADSDLSKPREDEDAYLLSALGWLFPDAGVSAADIVGRLHGVRPLVAADGGDVTGRSRDHAIRVHRSPLLGVPLVTIAGGKWTTFRAIAEDAAHAVLSRLGRPRRAPPRRCRSAADAASAGGGGAGAFPRRPRRGVRPRRGDRRTPAGDLRFARAAGGALACEPGRAPGPGGNFADRRRDALLRRRGVGGLRRRRRAPPHPAVPRGPRDAGPPRRDRPGAVQRAPARRAERQPVPAS